MMIDGSALRRHIVIRAARHLLLALLFAPALCQGALQARVGDIGALNRLSEVRDGVGMFGNSFTPETEVQVRPKGAKAEDAQWGKTERKAIKDLRPGDEVLALAEWKEPGNAKNSEGKRLDQRLSYEKVVDIVTSHREQTLVHITMAGGQTLTATEGHPFKTPEGWRDAILLRKGGQLLLKGNGDEPPDALVGSGYAERIAVIDDIRIEKKAVPVFNLEVSNAHTFFVGNDGALVHNGLGAYFFRFADDTWYAGKGDPSRMRKSIAERGGGKVPTFCVHLPASTPRDSYILEDILIERAGDINDPKSQNKRNSPGKRYRGR